jgi:PPP family 3-phenylpropionic acid transporter
LPGTFLFQILHGLSFAATHLGAMAALAALAPDDGRGRAQGMLGSVSALAFAAATLASGPLYKTLGPNLFAAMAPISLAGFVLAFLASRQCEAELPAQPQSSGAGGDTTLPS